MVCGNKFRTSGNMFGKYCVRDGSGIDEITNFTEYFVGGKYGGKFEE